MKKRIWAYLLTLVMVIGLLPTAALAEETQQEAVCAELEGCVDGSHQEDCPLYVAPVEEEVNEPIVQEPMQEVDEPTVEEPTQEADKPAVQEPTQEADEFTVEEPLDQWIAPMSQIYSLDEDNTADAIAEDGMSGTCGAAGSESGVTWALEQNGTGYTLTISGSDAMADYSGNNQTPWYKELSKIGATTSGYNGRSFININKIVIAEGVTHIGNSAFSFTTVSEIEIADTVESIGQGAFLWDCWLKNITIPASVTNMHIATDGSYYNPFDGTFNLERMTIGQGDSPYRVVQGGVLLGAVAEDSNELMIINCPDNLGNGETTAITADFPSNTTMVGSTAFGGCRNLKTISLPETITKIGSSAFLKCYALESFTVPSGVTTLSRSTFQGCSSLASVSLNNVEIIEEYAFGQIRATELNNDMKSCDSLTSIDLSGIKEIKSYAFDHTGLTSVTIPDDMKLHNFAFNYATVLKEVEFLGSYTIPEHSGGDTATANPFSNSKAIETISFADGSTVEITANIFENCTSLKKIDLSNVTLRDGKIGNSAFHGCTSLEEVILPKSSLIDIAYHAFNNTNLKAVRLPGTVTSIHQEAFGGITGLVAIDASTITNCIFGNGGHHIVDINSNVIIYLGDATVANSIPNTAGLSRKAVTDGGTFADNTTFEAGTLAEPIKGGYTFKGWYENEDCTGDPVTSHEAGKTYYAKWELETPVITVAGQAEKPYDGEGVVLSVPEIEGATYQWYKGSEIVLDATDNTLAVINVADSGTYKCTITVNGNRVDSNEIEVSITKASPSLAITPSAASMRGKGTVTLTIEGMIAGVAPEVACDDTGISIKDNGDGTYSVSLPNRTQTYTFTVTCGETENYYESSNSCTVAVRKKSSTSSSSSSSSEKTYAVSKANGIENGKVTVDLSKAEEGDKVTFTVTPDKGYEINKVTVKDADGNKIEVKEKGEGEYTFTMPDSKVEIKATFSKMEETPAVVEEAKPIILTIDQRVASVFGEPVVNDVAPIIRNDRTMLPIRFVAEALGGAVAWDGTQNKVTITKDELTIEMDAPAFIENSRTYLPLRFVAEHLGATVTWNAETQEVTILPQK